MNPTQDTTIPNGLDAGAVNLSRAIRQQEGGDYNNYTGDSGTSAGAYQWQNTDENGKTIKMTPGDIPSNFKADANKYGLNPNDFSPKNQDMVAYNKIKALKDSGSNVLQIASLWNSGNADSWQPGTVQAHGNTPEYAKNVNNTYQNLKNLTQGSSSTSTPIVPQQVDTASPFAGGQSFEQQSQEPNGGAPQGSPTLAGSLIRNIVGIVPRTISTVGGLLTGKTNQAIYSPYFGDVSGYGMRQGNTAGQRAKDVAGGILQVGAAAAAPFTGGASEEALTAGEAAETVAPTLGSKVIQGAKIGAGYGAAQNAGQELTNKDSTVGSVAEATVEGALGGAITGGAISGVLGGVSPALDKIKETWNNIGGRSADEILATKPEDLGTLSKSELELWGKAQNAVVKDLTEAGSKDIDTKIETMKAQTNKGFEDANKILGSETAVNADDLKEPTQKLFSDKSNTYQELADKAFTESGAAKDITHEDVRDQLDSLVKESGDIEESQKLVNQVKSDLGVNPVEKVPEVDKETGQSIINTEEPPEPTISTKDMHQVAKSYQQQIGRSARNGSRVYTPSEYEALQKYQIIMELLQKNGVDLSEANSYWREWKPLQNEMNKQIKPFSPETTKPPISKTLVTANRTASTGNSSAQIYARRQLDAFEEALGLPKGTIDSKTRAALEEVSKSQDLKEKIPQIKKQLQQDLKDSVNAKKGKIPGNLSDFEKQKWEALRTSNKRTIVRNAILIGLGISSTQTPIGKAVIHSVL